MLSNFLSVLHFQFIYLTPLSHINLNLFPRTCSRYRTLLQKMLVLENMSTKKKYNDATSTLSCITNLKKFIVLSIFSVIIFQVTQLGNVISMTYIRLSRCIGSSFTLYIFFRTPADTFADLFFENAYSRFLFKLQAYIFLEGKKNR